MSGIWLKNAKVIKCSNEKWNLIDWIDALIFPVLVLFIILIAIFGVYGK